MGCVLGMMIGFLHWITTQGMDGYVQIWSIVFLFFVLVLIVAFYVGGAKRIKEEKRMIAEAHNIENEANKKRLA